MYESRREMCVAFVVALIFLGCCFGLMALGKSLMEEGWVSCPVESGGVIAPVDDLSACYPMAKPFLREEK